MATTSTAYLHAAVAFSKIAGTLAAHHNQTLSWTPSSSSSSASAFTIKYVDIAGLQTSKAGAAQTALMIALANGAQVMGKSKVLLVFNAAEQTALEDREKFKTELANAVARNRAQQQQQQQSEGGGGSDGSATPQTTAPSAIPSTPGSSAPTPRGGTPDVAAPGAIAPSSAKRASDRPPPKTEMELRISVLRSNSQLRSLHKDVVLSGAMQDAEFWSHPQRQALIRAERAMLEQRQGRNARLADPKPTPNEAGEMKLSITAELIRDLFEQFPVVARAYEENVPAKLDESAFWTRYFQSKLYHRLRTSARSAASEHIVQDDPIFDRYLEDEDDQLEPRRHHNPHDRLLDLGATEEDHQETGNTKDWTMRAGAERRTLPLMRRFNDHSQSLLDSALGEQEEAERRARRVVGGVGEEYNPSSNVDADEREDVEGVKARYYREIEIDDLNETERVERVRLDVGELEGYFQAQDRQSAGAGGAEDGDREAAATTVGQKRKRRTADDGDVPRTMEEIHRVVDAFDARIKAWSPDMGEYRPAKRESELAMKVMLANVRSRTQGRGVNDLKTLPEAHQKSTTSLQASATEFLRQFWACLSPSSAPAAPASLPADASWNDIQAATANAQPAATAESREADRHQRRERAAKMLESLRKSKEKMEGLEIDVEEEVGEAGRRKVAVALGPTKEAIDRAIRVRL